MILLLLQLLACVSAPAEGPMVRAVLLDRSPDLISRIKLPDSSRDEVPALVAVQGPWRVVGTAAGVRTWEAPLPVRPRSLFFNNPPDDMALMRKGREVTHRRGYSNAVKANSWEFSNDALRVRRELGQGPPEVGEYEVRYSRARTREQSLNRAMSGLDDRAFLMRSLQVRGDSRHGLLMPAPAEVWYDLEIPQGAVLDLELGLVPSEAGDAPPSDGATFAVDVVAGGKNRRLLTEELRPGPFRRHRVDLSAFGGQQVTLMFGSLGGDDTHFDYVFAAEPVVHVPQRDPPRVVAIFIDTLRVDHLGVYGYERETSPSIDSWAEGAAVFDQARSIAPWTLPSTRSMWTGVVPERWGQAPVLPELLAEHGWATAFMVGNIYLSSNFEMERGWGFHQCVNWPRADVQVDRALEWLEANADRPAFLALHFMDMHLPYTEPYSYKRLFAGERPKAFSDDEFTRSEVLKAVKSTKEEGKQYIRDRYDNNLRYVDDQLKRLFAELGPDDTVLLLSDHGEEFWDHDDYEHGHSLYDELLHVPMILRGPGIQPGHYDAPVSILDVTPTLAAATGVQTGVLEGWPLQAVVDGSRSTDFEGRPQAFGRPLYGDRQWGSLSYGSKYIASTAGEAVYALAEDPGETRNLLKGKQHPGPGRDAMERALARPVRVGWRLAPSRSKSAPRLDVSLDVPGGVVDAWVGEDPTEKGKASVCVKHLQSDEGEPFDRVVARWPARQSGVREVFVVPTQDAYDVTRGLRMTVTSGNTSKDAVADDEAKAPDPDRAIPHGSVLQARVGSRTVSVDYTVVPLPVDDLVATDGADAEARDALEALGYVDGGDEGVEAADDDEVECP